MLKRLTLGIVSMAAITLAYASLALSVDNDLTESDIAAIETLPNTEACETTRKNFDREVACLKAIQDAVLNIGGSECASKSETIEPKQFLERNYGCCYDRARFIEKAARYFGFQTRHVFLIAPAYGISLSSVLPLGQSSHAASEILTVKGWVGVDSVEPFILLAPDNEPMTYPAAMQTKAGRQLLKPQGFFEQHLDVIYGLYSRHGFFHGRNLPGPEFVFSELLHNF